MKKKRGSQGGALRVMGKNCIRELLHSDPERIIRVLTAKPKPWEQDPLLKELLEKKIRVEKVEKERLHEMVSSESHQSYVAEVHPRPKLSLKELVAIGHKSERSLILALDSIMDPQNVGALLRAAECFGVTGVIWSKNRGSSITPVVTKASVGASEIIPIVEVSNLVEACRRLKEEEYWVVTAEVGKDAKPLGKLQMPERCVLVVGGEERGIQQLLSKEADIRVYIPMYGKIDSLNVSQATAVLLSHWRSFE